MHYKRKEDRRVKCPESTIPMYSLDLFKRCQPQLVPHPSVSCIWLRLCLLDNPFSGLANAHTSASISWLPYLKQLPVGFPKNTCDHHPLVLVKFINGKSFVMT